MPPKILLAYATTYGSTKEVAEAIAADLRASGADVDCLETAKVTSLDGYRAVVLGAPLFMGQWQKEAPRFLKHYNVPLSNLPVAVFALGPIHNTAAEIKGAGEELDKNLQRFAWLKPAAKTVFVGKVDPAKLKFPFKFAFKAMGYTDERAWDAIHAWAQGLAQTFKL